MAAKRYYLHLLRRYDQAHDDCAVRELEMVADSALKSTYIPQFWRDVALYGVEEAILYVKNGAHGDAEAIRQGWGAIKARMAERMTTAVTL